MNWAIGRPAEQSSDNDPVRLAYKAVDGNNKSHTHTAFEPFPWWKVHLGSVIEVQAVEIVNRNSLGCKLHVSNT